MVYSETIKARMLRRLMKPGGPTAMALSEETGISQSSLSKWLRQAGKVDGMAKKKPNKAAPNRDEDRRPKDWTPMEKLGALANTHQLQGEALGQYLRSAGLRSETLGQWRQDATDALTDTSKRGRSSVEAKRIKELERELRRKEKALAETAAILVLRKKANALWGDEDDNTESKNESQR